MKHTPERTEIQLPTKTIHIKRCGCQVFQDPNGVFMNECPLHKSAPDLMEYIEDITNPKLMTVGRWVKLMKTGRRLIAKAKGEAHEF